VNKGHSLSGLTQSPDKLIRAVCKLSCRHHMLNSCGEDTWTSCLRNWYTLVCVLSSCSFEVVLHLSADLEVTLHRVQGE
jgi:hypothetical protein